jgi:hypothetical protein
MSFSNVPGAPDRQLVATSHQGLRHVAVLVALLVIGALVYAPVFHLLPLGEDNFYVLGWADGASGRTLLTVDPSIYPEWRPLAYLTVWLQYQWVGIERFTDYYAVDIALWVAAAWLVYRIVEGLASSTVAGTAAALFVLVDSRAVAPVAWIVGRQGSLACVFGLFAV